MADLVDASGIVEAWDDYAARTDFRGNGPTFNAGDVRRWLRRFVQANAVFQEEDT